MCKPSCCKNSSSSEGSAFAAIAAIAAVGAGAIVAVKIGPIVARILHLVVEVLTIVMLTAATALACIIVGWLTIRIVRWQARRTRARQAITLRPVPAELIDTGAGCLACGGTGTVLRAITGSRYQPQVCPACEPAEKVGRI
jgi:hypothetical protein